MAQKGYRDFLPDKRGIDAFGLLQRAQFGPKQRLVPRLSVHLRAATKTCVSMMKSFDDSLFDRRNNRTYLLLLLPSRFNPISPSIFAPSLPISEGRWFMEFGPQIGPVRAMSGPVSIDGLHRSKKAWDFLAAEGSLSLFSCRTFASRVAEEFFHWERERERKRRETKNGRESEAGDVARRGSYTRLRFHARPPQAPSQVSAAIITFSAEISRRKKKLSFSFTFILHRA